MPFRLKSSQQSAGRRSAAVALGRAVQRLPLDWLRPLEAPLARAGGRSGSGPHVVMLLALPRSGSTLLYQSLVHSLSPLYLSNLWNILYALPWCGGRLSAKQCGDYRSDFCSNEGFVGGLCGPAEGLWFWSYWCGWGLEETPYGSQVSDEPRSRIPYLRRVLTGLSDRESPFVTGYLGHVLAIERIRQWFPETVWVRLERDPLSNAASILRSRWDSQDQWFSVFPRECEGMQNSGIHAQVASQVYWLNRRLGDVENDSRTIHIGYEEFCRHPNAAMQKVVAHCNGQGMRLQIRRKLPAFFDHQVVTPEDSRDTAQLADELRRLESRHGELSSHV